MIAASHEFQQRSLNALDENGNEGCAFCGRPRSVHPSPGASGNIIVGGDDLGTSGPWEAMAALRAQLAASARVRERLSADLAATHAVVAELREVLIQGGQDAQDARRRALRVIEQAGFATWDTPAPRVPDVDVAGG